ncbi:MAG TPA: hypothetical protein PLD25_27005 [Chloroflexota bacterium]|nr:hypothetical protein [Chloroflexota bacterium]HUM67254.1 hypothetical protein [Chloroflexota bacterium]
MRPALQFRPVAITIFIVLVISYALCIVGDLLFGWTMYQTWAPLLPGFAWPLTAVGFLVGLLWIIGYSLYGTALIVFPYNYLIRQQAA